MQVAKNFDIREFVSPGTFNKWGNKCIWFVDQKVIDLAQFAKNFFTDYFKEIETKEVEKVTITINNWLWKGDKTGRGYREPSQYLTGQFKKSPLSESLHRQGKAVDMVVTIHYTDGTKRRVPTKELVSIIQTFWNMWKQTGVACIEHWEDAPTWLHCDFRNTGVDELFIFKV